MSHLTSLDRLGRSPKTVHTDRAYARTTISPAIGDWRVRLLTALDLGNFDAQLGKLGRKPATIRQIHAILSGALGQAVKWRMVRVDVGRSASPPPVRQAKINVPTAVQVRSILTAADRRDPILGWMMMLAALTGAGRGDVCALRSSDVDPEAGLLTIAHPSSTARAASS